MKRTPEEIRALGLEALRRALGPGGMIEFIQQFARDTGDYAKDRRQWLDCLTVSDVRTLVAELQEEKRTANGKKRTVRRARKPSAPQTSRRAVGGLPKAR